MGGRTIRWRARLKRFELPVFQAGPCWVEPALHHVAHSCPSNCPYPCPSPSNRNQVAALALSGSSLPFALPLFLPVPFPFAFPLALRMLDRREAALVRCASGSAVDRFELPIFMSSAVHAEVRLVHIFWFGMCALLFSLPSGPGCFLGLVFHCWTTQAATRVLRKRGRMLANP